MKDYIIETFYPMIRFFRKLKTAWDFARFGFNDEDWDYQYLIDLMVWKLRRKAKYFKKSDLVEDNLKMVTEITKVADYLEAYSNGSFLSPEKEEIEAKKKQHREKWGELNLLREKDSDFNKPAFEYQSAKNVEEQRLASIEYMEIHSMEEQYLQKYLNKAFDLMKENIQGWWD